MRGRKLKVLLAVLVTAVFALVPSLAFAAVKPSATVTEAAEPNQAAPLYESFWSDTQIGTAALGYECTFKADTPTDEQLEEYGKWNCDFVVQFDFSSDHHDIEANSFGLYGGYVFNGMAGTTSYERAFYYPTTITGSSTPVYLMLSGFDGNTITYSDVVNNVSEFKCGVFNASNKNVGRKMTVDLVIWPTGEEQQPGGYSQSNPMTIKSVTYTFGAVPKPVAKVDDQLSPATDVPLLTGPIGQMADTGASVPSVDQFEFTAVEPAANTRAYYGDWDIDYEVTFNDDFAANTIGLYGAYDNQLTDTDYKVGYRLGDAIAAGTKIKMLAALGDSLSYNTLLEAVPSFKCGAFSLSDANKGKSITVNLVMWNEAGDELVLNTTDYTFKDTQLVDPKPKAAISSVDPVAAAPVYVGNDLSDASKLGTVAINDVYNFVPDENSGVDTAAFNAYKDWYADFVVTFDKDVAAQSMGLYGKYGTYGEVALLVPDVRANEGIWLLDTAFGLDSHLTYDEVVNVVQSFDCGAFNLADENKDTKMTVQLVLFQRNAEGNPINKIECGNVSDYVIGDAGVWMVDGVGYQYVAEGLDENGKVLVNGALVPQAESGPHFSAKELAKFSYSILLQDSIDITYYVKDLAGDPADYTIQYSFGGDTTDEIPLTNKGSNEFVIAKCAARQMIDEATVVVKYKGDVIKEATYSIRGYCKSIIESQSYPEQLKDLCKATLDYGSYAQKQFNYKTDDLANGGNDYYDNAGIATPTDPTAVEGEVGGITGQSLSLVTTSKTQFVILLKHDKGASIDDYAFAVDDETIDKASVIDDDNNKYQIWINGISAKDLSGYHTVTVTNNNGETYSYKASPVSYMGKAIEGGVAVEVNRAFYNYYLKAAAYFASLQ